MNGYFRNYAKRKQLYSFQGDDGLILFFME
jgi:hypothetical protein